MDRHVIYDWRRAVKLPYWSHDENSKLQSPKRSCGKRSSDQVSEGKVSLRAEESGRMFSVEIKWTMFERRTHVVSVMNQSRESVAEVRDEKDDRLFPHQIRRPRRTKGETILKHIRQPGGKFFRHKERNSVPLQKLIKTRCKIWHLHVCQNWKFETGCKYGRTCFFRHVEADEKPSKKSKKGGAKGSVALLKVSTQLGCVSQDHCSRKSFLREERKIGIRARRQILQGHVAPNQNLGKNGSIARNYPKVCASWA